MCLAIPMCVIELDGFNARCEAKGIERVVSLFLLQHETLSLGDYVLVHVGYAIQKATPEEARLAWEVYDEMLSIEDGHNGDRQSQDIQNQNDQNTDNLSEENQGKENQSQDGEPGHA